MRLLLRVLRALPLLLISPLCIFVSVLSLAVTDLLSAAFRRRRMFSQSLPSRSAVSIVIPTWNGRELLGKYLPSVVEAAAGNPDDEILVVDNASTDGTGDFLREHFPRVKVVRLDRNLGFGGGSNAGVRAARNDIVVLLNNDMRVSPDFVQPLLDGFTDDHVFSVSCQIFFSDPKKVREETGLTQGWWEHGSLRVRHRADEAVTRLFPCFYGGGGSCAYDRRKFLELGGFDSLFEPFYLEDTDLGYAAWKRGWKVLYEPRSVVFHEHRGTIGRRFSAEHIRSILAKNFILWSWKNIHEWSKLAPHFLFTHAGALLSLIAGDSPERATLAATWRAFRQLPAALRSRWRALGLAVIGDTEAFQRPLGGYFRDRFTPLQKTPERLRVLFVSPYSIFPPIHGGGVLMHQTLQELVRLCDVHLIALLDYPHELPAHEAASGLFASAKFFVRLNARSSSAGSMLPHAVREFANDDVKWLIHRQLFLHEIDVLQLEYTPLSQYAGDFRRIVAVLFEHDVYFQSIARTWTSLHGAVMKLKAGFEYLRAIHFETKTLPKLDRVQTCTRDNTEHLLSFIPDLKGRVQDGLRAGVDTSRYRYQTEGREPNTMLFIGSFRHLPNQAALDWFTRGVLPVVAGRRPGCRLVVVGSDPPPPHAFSSVDHIELLGFVEDVRESLSRYAVFVCPVLSGSGIRVKLLEAFASGIPVVSTRLGAEGLASEDGEICELADQPAEFAGKILALFDDPGRAEAMAARAREEVVSRWDIAAATQRLVESYSEAVEEKRARWGGTTSP